MVATFDFNDIKLRAESCLPNGYAMNEQGLWYFPPVPTAKRLHSAEKPVELLRFAIENISNDAEHDTVFDPFMGSGSTGVAAEMECRRFIGIELDERFYDVARKRIEEVGKQQSILQYTGQSQESIAR